MGNEICDPDGYVFLPDDLLFEIFSYLNRQDLMSSSEVCQQWQRVSTDEVLWKKLFLFDYKLNLKTAIAPLRATPSWYTEYRRLKSETPIMLTETITAHTDEVLHVSFSHDGSMFATCSKDCFVKVWCSDYPCQIICEINLREKFNWKYTQFSQFNADDRLLLISGVHFGKDTTTGEIVVFEVASDELLFRCRVVNKPYDVFGCWFSRTLLLNGELHFLGSMSSCSDIWVCRASQELQSVNKSVMAKLFKFVNFNASTIRMVLVSSHVSDWLQQAVEFCDKSKHAKETGQEFDVLVEMQKFRSATEGVPVDTGESVPERKNSDASTSSSCISKSSSSSSTTNDIGDRLLMFSTGTETYTPHQIGFKLVKRELVEKLLREEVMPSSRLEKVHARMREQLLHAENGGANAHYGGINPVNADFNEGNLNMAELQANFDFPDHLIDMRGHIIGMSLSADERYLFVNVRPWPDTAVITDPWTPPPIAQQIEVRVIDLEKLLLSPKIYCGHRGYTPNDECFFIFLDSCEPYVASGSEDKFAYLWDRHYNFQIAQLPHDGVVNSVAFNPKSPEMLISVSDDHSIKVWRSTRISRELKILKKN